MASVEEIADATRCWGATHLPFLKILPHWRRLRRKCTFVVLPSSATQDGLFLTNHTPNQPSYYRIPAEPSGAPEPEKCYIGEVGIPAELKRRPCHLNIGPLLYPHQDTVSCFADELPDVRNASPPVRPSRARALTGTPLSLDKASRNLAWADKWDRQRRYGGIAPRLNRAQMAMAAASSSRVSSRVCGADPEDFRLEIAA